jgi:hypothetical protein
MTAHAPTAELQRIGVKLCLDGDQAPSPSDLIPIFHRWIREAAVEGLLIDVADYSHVHHGPGVMLIAHEGDYALDMADGRPGLLYQRKQPLAGASLAERVAEVARLALAACDRLEEAPELGGRVRFRRDEALVIANDRLRAPATEASFEALKPAVEALADGPLPAARGEARQTGDLRERLTLVLKAPSLPEPGLD